MSSARAALIGWVLLAMACGEDSPASTGTGASGAASSSGVGAAGGSSGSSAAGGEGGTGGVGAAGGTGGSAPACNPTTGLAEPLAPCTAANPCTELAAELGEGPLTTPVVVPTCASTDPDAPPFDDGPPLVWTDPSGIDRHACLFQPTGASSSSTRPLLVWLHGGGGGLASDVYDYTTIRQKAATYDLTGDPSRPGFFLLSVQGKSVHYPTGNPRDGHHHDFYYRDLASPSSNPDIANVDKLIDELAATGAIDTARIYLMGWSNGGFFGQMYSIARHDTPTPGGHRVAAASVFSAADPFHNTSHSQSPSCQLDPYPSSVVPLFLVSRACDVVACDQTQSDGFAARGFETEPGHVVASWMADLATKVGNPNAQWRIVTGLGTVTTQCTAVPPCTIGGGTLNHVRWPNGVADNSGIDHEPAMLDFLRDHPLP